jgi:citrate synthase
LLRTVTKGIDDVIDEPGTSAVLHTPNGELTMTIKPASEGASAFDIGKLLSGTGLITYDPGYGNTAPVSSAITYIDGDAGMLRYRGYPIEQLAEKSTFLETSYLLIYGELPTQEQLSSFTDKIGRHTLLHEDLKAFFSGFPRDAHPMPVLSSAVSALSTFYQDALDPFDEASVELSTVRLLAKLPTIAAYAYKKSVGQPFLYPDNSTGLIENFLRMTFGFPAEPYEVDPEFTKALDLLLILHADHEQNCSTSTVRLVGSAHADLFASISAGINALFGPLHGGANEAVLAMLGRIRDVEDGNVDAFVERVKNKEKGARLLGFGHRVYRNYDPRAKIVKQRADEVLKKLGVTDPLLEIAKALEERALADDYFIERKLYPNVDFYTGVIYRAMGFPTKMFPVLFALGRLPGWISHWREMIRDPENRIGRPRQLYVGPAERAYVPVAQR